MTFRGRGRDGSRLGTATLVVATAGAAFATAPAQAAISVSGPESVVEGTGSVSATFTISRSGALLQQGASVRFRTTGGTAAAGADYTAVSETVNVPGSLFGTSVAQTVTVRADTLDEADETLTVTIDQVDGDTIDVASATTTIKDDPADLPPKVSVADAAAAEGTGAAGQVALPVTLSAVSGRTVTVPYTVQPGTAAAPEDLDASAGTLTIPAGGTGATVAVPTVGDDVDEPDETFTVTLGTPTAATVQAGTATGTVVNDDTPVASITGVAQAEGTGQEPTAFPFTVTLSNASVRPLGVRVSTADVQARAGGDYTAVSEVVTFAPGERSRTVVVPVAADAEDEPDEAFSVSLSEPAGVTLGTATALGAILDDDGAPSRPGAGGGPIVQGTGTGTGATPGGGTSGPAAPGTGADRTAPRAALRALRVRRPGALQVRITCPASETRCAGKVTVFSIAVRTAKLRALRREVRLAGGSYRLAGGATTTVTMRLTATGQRLLRSAKRFRARAYGVTRDAAGNVGTSSVTATLRR